MREYSQFQASFWTGETGKQLQGNVDAQLLAAYLFTSRHSNQIGLYYLPLAYAAHELGMSIDRVSAAINAVSGCGFALYDTKSEHVWVCKMAPKQITRSPKAITGALKELRLCAENPLKRTFVATYGPGLERLHSDTVRIGYPESASEQNKTKPNQDQDQDQEPSRVGTRGDGVELQRIAADLVADNHAQTVPPVGESPAAPELEAGEPTPRPRQPPGSAFQAEVLELFRAAYAAGPMPHLTPNQSRAAVSRVRDLAEHYGVPLEAAAVEVCQAAGPGSDAWVHNLARVDPYTKIARASPRRGNCVEPSPGTTAEDFQTTDEEFEQQRAALRAGGA